MRERENAPGRAHLHLHAVPFVNLRRGRNVWSYFARTTCSVDATLLNARVSFRRVWLLARSRTMSCPQAVRRDCSFPPEDGKIIPKPPRENQAQQRWKKAKQPSARPLIYVVRRRLLRYAHMRYSAHIKLRFRSRRLDVAATSPSSTRRRA